MVDEPAHSRPPTNREAGRPIVTSEASTVATQNTAGVSSDKPASGNAPWKESAWRWGRRVVLLLTAIGVAVATRRNGIVSPDTPLQETRFVQLLETFGALMVVLMITGRMGPRADESSTIETLPASVVPPQEKEKLTTQVWQELLTLEYQKGAERYENIYKAIWLNFSYSVAVGAAIITFGATKLRIDLLQFVALCPIVFWFVATFIPMNHYGELTRGRLRDIEKDLNAVFFRDSSGKPIRYGNGKLFGFQHFARFGDARAAWRVGDVVHITGALVGLYWLWTLSAVMTNPGPPPRILAPQPDAVGAPVAGPPVKPKPPSTPAGVSGSKDKSPKPDSQPVTKKGPNG
jgi:hypothetical protein